MKKLIKLMKRFEKRWNIEIKVEFFSDGSNRVIDYNTHKLLFMSLTNKDLKEYLKKKI